MMTSSDRRIESIVDANGPLDPERTTLAQSLRRLIVGQTVAVLALTAMIVVAGLLAPEPGILPLTILGGIAISVGIVSYVLLRFGQIHVANYVFLIGTALAITANVYVRGYRDASALYYLWPIVCAATLMSLRGGVLIAFVSSGLYGILIVLQRLGYLAPLVPYDPQGQALLTVGSRIVVFFLLTTFSGFSNRDLRRSLRHAHSAADRLRILNTTLEQRVAERTTEIESRTRYLEATAIVSREVNSVLDVEKLLNRVVHLISDQFGFYHTGLFLVDEQAQWAVLRAASSEGGRRMLARGHRLRVGQQGVVGWVADRGEHRIALDVGQDAVYFDNPDLPDTRSEMALPLRARGKILGVLDVQSTESGLFGSEDVSALQALADQVALAISNARLFERAEAALLAERKVQGEQLHEAWRDLIRTTGQVGFISDYRGTTVADGEWGKRMLMAVQSGETASANSDRRALAVPVKVRGQTIGAIDAYQPVDGGEWTAEQRELLETLAERVGLALESAQLYEEAQNVAVREQLAMRISQRVREALDVEDILRVASNALGRELDAREVVIRLGTEQILLGKKYLGRQNL